MKKCLEVVTGFLGSGKSGFINSLITLTMIPNDKILVIQLESGATSIDTHPKVKSIKFNKDLNLLSSFILQSAYEFDATRVIIEYNGTLPLEDLYENLNQNKFKKDFYLGANYFLCDAKTIDSYLINMGGILIPFIANANIITVTNTLDIPSKGLSPSLRKLKNLNRKAFIICSDTSKDLYSSLLKSKLFNRKLLLRALYSLSKYLKRNII